MFQLSRIAFAPSEYFRASNKNSTLSRSISVFSKHYNFLNIRVPFVRKNHFNRTESKLRESVCLPRIPLSRRDYGILESLKCWTLRSAAIRRERENQGEKNRQKREERKKKKEELAVPGMITFHS